MENNSKIINHINQMFHNNGIKQEERFNLLIVLLENIKNGKSSDNKFNELLQLISSFDYTNADLMQEIFMIIGSKYTKYNLDQFYTPTTISKFINNL
jgi:hypothetical protein